MGMEEGKVYLELSGGRCILIDKEKDPIFSHKDEKEYSHHRCHHWEEGSIRVSINNEVLSLRDLIEREQERGKEG
jgi:hypothetical protein